jgi:hypothetical protein
LPSGWIATAVAASFVGAEVGDDDAVAVEALVERPVRVVADEREIEQTRFGLCLPGRDDLAVGLDCHGVGDVAPSREVGRLNPGLVEAGVRVAAGGVAHDAEVDVPQPGGVGLADGHETAVGQHGGVQGPVVVSAQVGGRDPAGTEVRIEVPVGVVTGGAEVEVEIVPHPARADGADPAVRRDQHRPAFPRTRRGEAAVVPERGVEPRRDHLRGAVHGDVGHVRAGHMPGAVLDGADLVGVGRLGLDLDLVGLPGGRRPREGEGAVRRHRQRRPQVREHQPRALEPVDRAADRELGRRWRERLVVIADRHDRPALRAELGAVRMRQRDREPLRALGRHVLADRDLHEPRRRVVVAEPHPRARRCEITARLRRAACRRDVDAGGAARPAGTGDLHQRLRAHLADRVRWGAERDHPRLR